MQLRQSDLFQGVGHHFLKEVMQAAENVAFSDGQVVFREDDPAEHFYILATGCVKLTLSDPPREVYTAASPGEVIGWSSLIGRPTFSLTATCRGPTVLMRIGRRAMNRILASDSDSGARFFRQLAGALGNRLMHLYPRLGRSQADGAGN